jgi:histidinol-phosphate aminotransferase
VSYEYERVAPAAGLRLHLNENTAGCSPAVVAAIRALTAQDLAIYPDYDRAIAACAARLGVKPEALVLTNGLDEGILAAAMVAFRDSTAAMPLEGIVVVPAFDMYAACTDTSGGQVVEVPLGPSFEFPLDAVLAAVNARTRMVWLTNPNNPTGRSIPRDAIVRTARAAPHAIVFVDEAYVDFGGHSLLNDSVLDDLPHVVVGRTFAKAYGLAGVRLGAVLGHPDTIARLRRVMPPYSINACAAVALPAAFADTAYYDWYVGEVAESKMLLYRAFDRLGIEYWKSDANFVLARFPNRRGSAVAAALARRGVHVRDRTRDPGCADCLRITSGVVDHTRRLLAALEEVL